MSGPAGPVLIQVFDGTVTADQPTGNAIFTYGTRVELPKENAIKDFDLKEGEVKRIDITGPPPWVVS
jgi:hypothetical protein